MIYAAAVTLYNPNIDNLNNLKNTSELFDILYVYDNTENVSDYIDQIKMLKNCVYIGYHRNDGLPVAFNMMLKLAYKDKVDYLCTLDQDSVLTIDNVSQIKTFIQTNNMNRVAIVAPIPTGTSGKIKGDVQSVKWVICSGSFLNLSELKRNNISYDESYFIDRFDADICMQMRRKKLKIFRLNYIKLSHCCGDGNGGHSSLRHYYMFRNRYYFNDKYFSWPISKIITTLQNIRHLKWVYEVPENINKRKMVYKTAREDYKNNLLGKASESTINSIIH